MDKELLKKRLNALYEQGKKFSFAQLPKGEYGYPERLTPDFLAWVQRVSNSISTSYAPECASAVLVERASGSLYNIIGNGPEKFDEKIEMFLKALEEGIKTLEDDFYGELLYVSADLPEFIDTKKIFIVHGHNHAAKAELEIFLRELGLDPIVLHREADEGLTVIEKFEKHSNVGYAMVLLTPDDIAHPSIGSSGEIHEEYRARQNVVFELGFFVGMLGRDRVCCLNQKNVTPPSDLSGLVYKPFHDHIDEVKYTLVKELRKAGYDVSF